MPALDQRPGSVPQSTVSGNVPVAVAARIAPRILPGGPQGWDPLYEQTGL